MINLICPKSDSWKKMFKPFDENNIDMSEGAPEHDCFGFNDFAVEGVIKCDSSAQKINK